MNYEAWIIPAIFLIDTIALWDLKKMFDVSSEIVYKEEPPFVLSLSLSFSAFLSRNNKKPLSNKLNTWMVRRNKIKSKE